MWQLERYRSLERQSSVGEYPGDKSDVVPLGSHRYHHKSCSDTDRSCKYHNNEICLSVASIKIIMSICNSICDISVMSHSRFEGNK